MVSEDALEWGQGDLNPCQRVSTTWGATPREIMSHRSSYSSQLSANPFLITLDNWSPPVYQVSLYPRVRLICDQDYCLRIFCALFLLLIFFLRHFQRWLPRFFQAREPLFMLVPSLNANSFGGGPVGIRTRGIWLRRPALYPS